MEVRLGYAQSFRRQSFRRRSFPPERRWELLFEIPLLRRMNRCSRLGIRSCNLGTEQRFDRGSLRRELPA